MNCSRCGTQNNEGDCFCKKCGSLMILEPATAQPASLASASRLFCPQCSKTYSGSQKFCAVCGVPLQVALATKPPESAPADCVRFCKSCGTPAISATAFCANCGKPLLGRQELAPNPSAVSCAYANTPTMAAFQSPVLCTAVSPPVSKTTPRRKHLMAIAIGIPAIALLLALAIFVLPTFLVSKYSTQIGTRGGEAVLADFHVIFDEGAVEGPVNVTVTDVTPQQKEKPAGLQSQLYMLEADELCVNPVTVRLALPASIDTKNLMLGIGAEIVSSDGTTAATSYRYVEAKHVDGALEAQIVPAEYSTGIGFYSRADAPSVVLAAASTPVTRKKPQKIKLTCGIFATEVYYEDDGHFKLYYPTGPNDNVNKRSYAYKLLDDLEEAYNAFLEAGFSYYDRSTWPVAVHIVPMDVEGAYIENDLANLATGRSAEHGWIELNSKNFASGYKRELLKGIIGHEWFHFVQANYCTSGITSSWLADATATWYEGNVTKGIPNIIMQYIEKLFDGVIPINDTAADGYARAPVIKYLVEKYGTKCILQTYQSIDKGTDPRAALIAATDDPTVWAGDCYEYIVSGNTQDADPYKFYTNICNKDPATTPFSSIVNLPAPSAEELSKAAVNQTPITLGTQQVTVPATGARLVAFTTDSKLAKALPDGTSLVIKVEGPPVDYRLFSIDGIQYKVSKSGSNGIVINDLKSVLGGDTKFLLLITSISEGDKKVFSVTAQLQTVTSPTLDEIVGFYNDGSATLQDVHVEQAVFDTLDGIIAQGDSGADNYKQNITGLQAQIGAAMPLSFDIRKTGDASGEIVGGGVSLPFTYANGVITISKELKNDDGRTYEDDRGTLSVTYDINKGIAIAGSFTQTLDGFYSSSQYYFPQGSFYLVKQLTGSKPAG